MKHVTFVHIACARTSHVSHLTKRGLGVSLWVREGEGGTWVDMGGFGKWVRESPVQKSSPDRRCGTPSPRASAKGGMQAGGDPLAGTAAAQPGRCAKRQPEKGKKRWGSPWRDSSRTKTGERQVTCFNRWSQDLSESLLQWIRKSVGGKQGECVQVNTAAVSSVRGKKRASAVAQGGKTSK